MNFTFTIMFPLSSYQHLPDMRPSRNSKYSMAVAQLSGVVLVSLMVNVRKKATWLCKLRPTPGRLWVTGTFTLRTDR